MAINGAPVGVPEPAAIVFTAKVAVAANVGVAPIVIVPAVVAVLLDAINIDLV